MLLNTVSAFLFVGIGVFLHNIKYDGVNKMYLNKKTKIKFELISKTLLLDVFSWPINTKLPFKILSSCLYLYELNLFKFTGLQNYQTN